MWMGLLQKLRYSGGGCRRQHETELDEDMISEGTNAKFAGCWAFLTATAVYTVSLTITHTRNAVYTIMIKGLVCVSFIIIIVEKRFTVWRIL